MERDLHDAEDFRRRALFIGRDWLLFQEVEAALHTTHSVSMEHEPPSLWPQDLDAVFIQAGKDPEVTFDHIRRVVTQPQGGRPFLLIGERDVDFILKASRLGVQDFVEVPEDVPQLASIVHMGQRHHEGRGGIVSAFFSLKGGVGCTALAVNTAGHLAGVTAGRTVLVDLNVPLGDVALYVNLDETYSIGDFIYNMGRFDEKLVYESLSRHESGIYLMGLPKNFEDLDQLTPEAIKATLNTLRRYFDHVVVDCASDLSALTLSCLDAADHLVLVTEPTLAALRATQSVYTLTRQLGYPREKIKMVLNRHSALGEEVVDEIIDAMELTVSARVSNGYRDFLRALNEGVLLHYVAPESAADRQIRAIAEMLHHGTARAEEVVPRRRRFALFRRPLPAQRRSA